MGKISAAGKDRRAIHFIEKKFQTQFIVRFCMLVFLSGLLTIALIYFLAMRSTTVSIINSRVVVRTTADFLLPLLTQTVAIVVILISIITVFLALYASHKIAGPLYNLKRTMQRLKDGDFSLGFRIRHLDQLQELANTVDEAIIKTRNDLKTLKSSAHVLREGLERIPDSSVSEDKKIFLSDSRKAAIELEKTLNHFKV